MDTKNVLRLAACAALVMSGQVELRAEDAPPALGWSDTAELSLVATDGNTESTSLGFKNHTERRAERSLLTFNVAGIRVESQIGSRTAVQDASGDIEVVDPETDVTAEAYEANGRYERKISERMFWFAGVSWEKNEFAGFDSRWIGEGGIGNIWYDRDDLEFRTSYGLTFTKQDDIVENPDVDDSFLGYRFAWNYRNLLGAVTTYTNDLKLDGNADEGSDWRGDMANGLAVAMSKTLALKLGLRLLYDNEPSLENVALFDTSGGSLGTTTIQLDELDTILTASLVVTIE